MWAPVVVQLDPVTDHPARVLLRLEPVPVHALLLQRPDDAFDHAVLLWTVRRDDLLLEAVAAHQAGYSPVDVRFVPRSPTA